MRENTYIFLHGFKFYILLDCGKILFTASGSYAFGLEQYSVREYQAELSMSAFTKKMIFLAKSKHHVYKNKLYTT